MKKILCTTLLGSLLLHQAAFAGSAAKTRVDIMVDGYFLNKNILFMVTKNDGTTEEIGIHKAGKSLVSQQYVNAISDALGIYEPTTVVAYVSDANEAFNTRQYISKYRITFKPDAVVGLSFPTMFY